MFQSAAGEGDGDSASTCLGHKEVRTVPTRSCGPARPGAGLVRSLLRARSRGHARLLRRRGGAPWDVVESLLQDLAAARGNEVAAQESVRAAALYTASAGAHDRRPGGRQALVDRLGLMLREQTHAAQRLRAAGGDGAHAPGVEPDALAWARDDHARATARCAELRNRLAAVESTVPDNWFRADGDGRTPEPEHAGSTHQVPEPRRPSGTRAQDAGPGPEVRPAPKRRKPRGARFAGLELEDDTEAAPAPSVVPVLPEPTQATAVPRGARFGGAPRSARPSRRRRLPPTRPPSAPPTTPSHCSYGCARRVAVARRTWCSARRRPGRPGICRYSQ